jgi:hypothetical protein
MVEKEAREMAEEAAGTDLVTREDRKLEEEQRFLFGSTDVRRAVRERTRLAMVMDDIDPSTTNA